MAKNTSTRLRGQELKDANAKISKLRKLGLYSGKAARGQPTKYALSLTKKFETAINGTASVVTVPKDKLKGLSKKYAGIDTVQKKSGKFIIHKDRLSGETARYDKARERLVLFGTGKNGKRYTREPLNAARLDDIAPAPPGKFHIYRVPLGKQPGGWSQEFDTLSELNKFMRGYVKYKNWREYVEVLETDDD